MPTGTVPYTVDRRRPSPGWIARGGPTSVPGYTRTPSRSPGPAAGIENESGAPNSKQCCMPSLSIGTGSQAGWDGQEIRGVAECETAYLVNVDPQNKFCPFCSRP